MWKLTFHAIHSYFDKSVHFSQLYALWCKLSMIAQMSHSILQLFMGDPEAREDIYSLQHIIGLP